VGTVQWLRYRERNVIPQKFALPNKEDKKIYALTQQEMKVVFDEISEQGVYNKMETRDGDTIFDVGANIGMFTVCKCNEHRNLIVYSFEPVPQTHMALKLNGEDCNAAGKNNMVQTFCLGFSDKEQKVNFNHNSWSSIGSSMYSHDTGGKPFNPFEVLRAITIDLHKWKLCSDWTRKFVLNTVANSWILRKLSILPLIALGIRMKILTHKVEVSLSTISDFLDKNPVKRIDLMKIDVERAELDVLKGIKRDEHWDLIQQLVVEVHDIDGRVKLVEDLLKSKGFKINVSQENLELHKIFEIFIISATRIS